jgi:hypothetical protein
VNHWTWQTLIEGRMTLTAFCHACNHSQDIDLAKLRDKYGPDASAMRDDVLPKLKCARCESTDIGLTYTPDTSPRGDLASPFRG